LDGVGPPPAVEPVPRPSALHHMEEPGPRAVVARAAGSLPNEWKDERMLKTLATIGFALALVGTAEAARLAAGPLRVGGIRENPPALDCAIANVGKTPVTVTITSVFREAEPVVQGPFVLQPGEADALQDTNEQSLSRVGYCTFDVRGRAENVRATACVVDGDLDCQGAVPAH
jgi:hypothetical protein